MENATVGDAYRAISAKAQYCCYWAETLYYIDLIEHGGSLELSARYIYTVVAGGSMPLKG